MKVLILGSLGGLGQAFMEVYQDVNPVGLDRSEVDITDSSQVTKVISELKPKLVINCAAYTNVDGAESDYEKAEEINGKAPGFIAAACKEVGAIMVHYSSGMVFDGLDAEGYNEDAVPNPINAYGQSKLLGEQEVARNTDKFYLIRSAWLFGKPKTGKKSFIDIMLELASKNDSVKCVVDETGCPTFDFDLAQATRALIEVGKPSGIYHLVNSGRASRYEWAAEIFRIRNLSTKLLEAHSIDFPRPAKRLKYEVVNNTKFIELRPWQEALEEFLTK